jgi:competence protein ComEA
MLKKLLAVVFSLFAALAMAAVDVNKATEAELDGVKGIGPATSKLIMAERKKAPFKNWEDFTARVKGVGDARAAKLSDEGLTINGSAFKTASASKPAAAEPKNTAAAKPASAEAKPAVAVAAKPAASGAKK